MDIVSSGIDFPFLCNLLTNGLVEDVEAGGYVGTAETPGQAQACDSHFFRAFYLLPAVRMLRDFQQNCFCANLPIICVINVRKLVMPEQRPFTFGIGR